MCDGDECILDVCLDIILKERDENIFFLYVVGFAWQG